MAKHQELTGAQLHVPGFVTDTDPGAVGAGIQWLDITDPAAPVLKVRNSADDGWITLVSAGTGGALDSLTDVDLTTPADGDVLAYDSDSSKWINSSAAGGGGGGTATSPGLMTSDIIGALSWFQQNSATFTLDPLAASAAFSLPAVGSNQLSSIDHTLSTPASDWKLRAYLWPACPDTAGFTGGLTIRESATGKMVSLLVVRSGGSPTYGLYVWKWAAYNSFGSEITHMDLGSYVMLLRPVTLEIRKTGSTISYRYNFGEGGETIELASESVTSSFTTQPNHVGIGANAAGAIASTFNVGWLDFTN